jgi:photosystem II stability/assembly factor-like uncharacterized protein
MKKMVSLLVLLLTVFSISVQAEPWNIFLYGPFETNFNSIHFTSSDEGWVVGDGEEVVLHYLREGYGPSEPSWEDWKVDTTGFPKCLDDCTYTWNFNSVYFISPNEGWVVGTNSDVFHYLNGIWSQVNVPAQGSLMSIYFLSPDEGWVVGMDYNFGGNEKGLILHYHNGVWYQAEIPIVNQGWTLHSVYFTSSDEGWAVGYKWGNTGDYKGVILHYLNGTWNLVNLDLNVACWSLDSVYFTSSDEGWVVGWDRDSTGIVLHYLNGTWNRENFGVLGRDWELNSVYFTPSNEGWAVGYDYSNFDQYAAYGGRGIILHYLNGVWSVMDQNLDNLILNSVNFTSPSEGWIAGQLIENRDCNYAVCGRSVLLRYSPPTQYTLTVNVTGSGSVSKNPNKSTYTNGEQVILTATANPGYTFTNWTGAVPNPPNPNSSIQITIAGDTFVTANFTQDQYTLTVNTLPSGAAGSVTKSPNKSTYVYGEQVTLTASPNSGYKFNSWNGVDSSNSTTAYVTLNSNRTVIANFIEAIGPDLTGSWTSPLTQTCKPVGKRQRCALNGTFTVTNIGNRDASSTYVNSYLSDDSTYENGDPRIKSAATGKLKPGKSKIIKLKLNLAAGQTASGKYVITVIDKDNMVTEIDETNNQVIIGPF